MEEGGRGRKEAKLSHDYLGQEPSSARLTQYGLTKFSRDTLMFIFQHIRSVCGTEKGRCSMKTPVRA